MRKLERIIVEVVPKITIRSHAGFVISIIDDKEQHTSTQVFQEDDFKSKGEYLFEKCVKEMRIKMGWGEGK